MDRRLLNDMQAAYGLAVTQIQPLTGGWLNELWKVTTQRGDLLVKRFSHRRYSAASLEKIEQALERQRQVAAQGIPAQRSSYAAEKQSAVWGRTYPIW